MTDDTPWWEQPDKPMEIIPAGTVMAITVGAFSSYQVCGIFRALFIINPEELRTEWMKLHPDQVDRFEEDKFLAWLFGLGLLEQIDFIEWHLTDFGGADEMRIETP